MQHATAPRSKQRIIQVGRPAASIVVVVVVYLRTPHSTIISISIFNRPHKPSPSNTSRTRTRTRKCTRTRTRRMTMIYTNPIWLLLLFFSPLSLSQSAAPSDPPIYDPSACLVIVQDSECSSLLETIPIDSDCNCYNFCGGTLLGCCKYGEVCPLSCSGGLVAGCVFESPSASPSTTPPTQKPSPVPTSKPTSKPTQTSNPTASECLISVNNDLCGPVMAEAEADLVDDCDCYNFCSGASLSCCSYGEVCDTYNCPAGGTDFVAGCEAPAPTPAPTVPLCQVVVSTDQCGALMPTITVDPDDGCDCYNFCNGQEMACCAFDASCPLLQCDGDFVAGCQDIPPTPAPTNEPMCLVSVNTQECPQLTYGQTPIEDCDCYNYCNGQYIGCCPYGEFCGFECQGNLGAGCEIEPKCLIRVNVEECSSLVENQPPTQDCDCYDYCNGELVGCCAYDTFCGLNCAGPDIVAGCQVDAEASPAPAPVPQQGWPFHFWPDGMQQRYATDPDAAAPTEL